jgi:exodeoxyribonuclease-5
VPLVFSIFTDRRYKKFIMKPKKDQDRALEEIKSWFNNSKKRSHYMVLSGYAGTGKSTLLSWIQTRLGLRNHDIIFTSFTGKATNVLARQGLRCCTLHRLLYHFKFNQKTGTYITELKLEGLGECLVVVDEASMTSKKLFEDLMKIHGNFKVLFVGDDAQLPPVDSEFNIMEMPDFRLTKVLRQAALNPIIRLATKIRNGEDWKIEKSINEDGLGYMPVTEEALQSAIEREFENDVFLCSTNRDRVSINTHIRDEIIDKRKKEPDKEPDSLDTIFVSSSKKPGVIGVGDRIIILDNCKKQAVFNGQLFMVSKYRKVSPHRIIMYGNEVGVDDSRSITLHPYNFAQEKAISRFDLSKKYRLDFKNMGVSGDYAYCLTVHKSQGSEFDNVFLQLKESDKYIWGDMYNRWLYTAVTRASKNLYFV